MLLPYVTGDEVQDRDAADALLADLKPKQPTQQGTEHHQVR